MHRGGSDIAFVNSLLVRPSASLHQRVVFRCVNFAREALLRALKCGVTCLAMVEYAVFRCYTSVKTPWNGRSNSKSLWNVESFWCACHPEESSTTR